MAPTPSTSSGSVPQDQSQDNSRPGIFQRRPPGHESSSDLSGSQNGLGTGKGTGAGAGPGGLGGLGGVGGLSSHEPLSSSSSRPQIHPIQQELHQQPLLNEAQLRSFSTASALPLYLPSSPPTLAASQSRNSITETLKEHRWSKGLRLNWVPGFSSSHQVAGLDGSLVMSSSSSKASSSK
ncbi:hypothetical protein BG000_010362 [Podila horticola]|nr:hypothetical protein BG000_010362 [Podila horticola]